MQHLKLLRELGKGTSSRFYCLSDGKLIMCSTEKPVVVGMEKYTLIGGEGTEALKFKKLVSSWKRINGIAGGPEKPS